MNIKNCFLSWQIIPLSHENKKQRIAAQGKIPLPIFIEFYRESPSFSFLIPIFSFGSILGNVFHYGNGSPICDYFAFITD